MSIFSVEYLIIVENKDQFCQTKESLNQLLLTVDSISFNASTDIITYKSFDIKYENQFGEVPDKSHRFFDLKFIYEYEDIEVFQEFIRQIRIVLNRVSKLTYCLWDDVSFYYTQKAYPLIHDVENIMRKLITKFMLINVGVEWTKTNVPQEVINSNRNKSKKDERQQNYLFNVDFIQLSNFLFEKYTPGDTNSILNSIRKAKAITDIDLIEIKKIPPQSNWERYFSKIIDCEGDYLETRWRKLYDIRNEVAHNKPLNKAIFQDMVKLIEEIKPKLVEAINGLENINISTEERLEISENLSTLEESTLKTYTQDSALEAISLAINAANTAMYSAIDHSGLLETLRLLFSKDLYYSNLSRINKVVDLSTDESRINKVVDLSTDESRINKVVDLSTDESRINKVVDLSTDESIY